MITITWYNIIGILLVIAFAYSILRMFVDGNKSGNFFADFCDGINDIALFVVTLILTLIWGGIFWW
jgi:hypothetical protein